MEVKWIKLALGVFDNRKIKQLASKPKGDTLIVIWIEMLCLAGKLNQSGRLMLTSTMPYTAETLAVEFNRSAAVMKTAVREFEELELIDRDEAGVISMHDWADHQDVDGMERVREQDKERQKRYRNKKRSAASGDSNVTDNVTGNVTVTSRNGTEKEEEREKEYQSFILSDSAQKSISVGSVTGDVTRDAYKRRILDGELGKGVVMLSDAEFDDLCDRLSVEELDHYVGVIADNELNGKKYKRKTHYQAILQMAEHDRGVKGGKS